MKWSNPYLRRMGGGFRFGIFCFALLATFGCRSSVDELRIQAAFAIQDGLDFVAASQTPTGGFVTDSWQVDNPKEIEPVDATFTASQILFSLSFCSDSVTARGTCNRAVTYLLAHAESEQFRNGSPYYQSPEAFTRAFSRAYADGGARCLDEAVAKIRAATLSLQKSDGGWGDDLETADGVITLLNLGYRGDALDRGIRSILARQSADGGWALTTVYRGIGVPLRYGARSVTTAVCVEALTKYSKL